MAELNKRDEILKTLSTAFPFRFLSSTEKNDLVKDISLHYFPKSTVVLKEGSLADNSVYIVKSGAIRTFTSSAIPDFIVRVIKKNHYFGERVALFGVPYPFGFKVLKDAECYRITGERFLRLIHDSPTFAASLSNILRDKQGIFAPFEHFSVVLMQGVTTGSINVARLLELYRLLKPALHPRVQSKEIDFSALNYAVKRLPENVTRTFAYLFTDELPTEFVWPDRIFKPIKSDARRRNIWEMLPGKNMVLVRSGKSDLIDIITCLCLYAVEVYKIRLRFHNPKLILMIEEFLRDERKDFQKEKEFLMSLPFSEDEIASFKNIWPHDTLSRLHQITRHREMINIEIRRQVHNYNSHRTELWTEQISEATQKALGLDPGELPPDVRVHIISSNTHSIINCLNPFFVKNSDKILDWAKKKRHKILSEEWKNKYDLIYALSKDYLSEHEDIPDEIEFECGILKLHETASTGIKAQLIDTEKLRGYEIDPSITPVPKTCRALILNIDYAFGEQAEDILRNLIILFSRNLASINILGKAGALCGKRGDILIPTTFIEQKSDLFHPVVSNEAINSKRLQGLLPGIGIHTGPLLTVSGTLLQNQIMLNFYKHIWKCIGLEMEGFYYLRQILESNQIGVVSGDIPLRFLYYVSDLPLKKADESLSVPLKLSEGIPPLYGITREILSSIFEQESEYER